MTAMGGVELKAHLWDALTMPVPRCLWPQYVEHKLGHHVRLECLLVQLQLVWALVWLHMSQRLMVGLVSSAVAVGPFMLSVLAYVLLQRCGPLPAPRSYYAAHFRAIRYFCVRLWR